jgi:phospholipase C
LSDGFVRVNDSTEQIDNGVETATEDQTIGFYNQTDIPFYYDLAQKFAISDRHFSSLLGPTFPNRSYLMAATSFGHLTTDDTFPPPGSTGYKPITGIFDLLDKNNITWADYFQDAPQGASFRLFTPGSISPSGVDPHFLPLATFYAQAAAGTLPSVSFVDPNFGLTGTAAENDEHPPTDIQRGQAFVSQVITAVRNSPN